jgi:hypothetical protein
MSAEMANEIKLISGSSHPDLSAMVARRYDSLVLQAALLSHGSHAGGVRVAH